MNTLKSLSRQELTLNHNEIAELRKSVRQMRKTKKKWKEKLRSTVMNFIHRILH